jgi:hypothetical protein
VRDNAEVANMIELQVGFLGCAGDRGGTVEI